MRSNMVQAAAGRERNARRQPALFNQFSYTLLQRLTQIHHQDPWLCNGPDVAPHLRSRAQSGSEAYLIKGLVQHSAREKPSAM